MTVEDLLNSYGYPLKAEGNNYKILCPFHDDSTPSLKIHKESGGFKCFSCGTKGSVLDLIVKIESISYQDAVAKFYGKNSLDVITNPYLAKKTKELTLDQKLHLKYLEIKKLLTLLYFDNFESEYWLIEWEFLKGIEEWEIILRRQEKIKQYNPLEIESNRSELYDRRSYLEILFEWCDCYVPDKLKYVNLIDGLKNSPIKEDLVFINRFLTNPEINFLICENEEINLLRLKIKLRLELLKFKSSF